MRAVIIYMDVQWLSFYQMGKLKFVNDFDLNKILTKPDDNTRGYIINNNLHFCIELHDKLKDDPPAPENLTPALKWISNYQKAIG